MRPHQSLDACHSGMVIQNNQAGRADGPGLHEARQRRQTFWPSTRATLDALDSDSAGPAGADVRGLPGLGVLKRSRIAAKDQARHLSNHPTLAATTDISTTSVSSARGTSTGHPHRQQMRGQRPNALQRQHLTLALDSRLNHCWA